MSDLVFLGGVASLALGCTLALLPASASSFARYFGTAGPALVVTAVAAVGGVSIAYLRSRFGFAIVRGRETLRGPAVAAGIATVAAMAIVPADLLIRYPEDTNVPVPAALLFYPAIGVVAEVVFLVAPLAMLLLLLSPLRARLGTDRVVWIAMIVVATLEPTFQVTLGGGPLTLASAYTWIHVGALALAQLAVLRRYDFAAMLALRLVYYAYWHILWGVMRLELLF
jgi:hypothetical protein